MPEGHTVHRIANAFQADFAGRKVTITSPQGRFNTEAALVSGLVLKRARAIGKQMFLEFDGGAIVRIHLGIYGKWQFHDSATAEITGQVRARFISGENCADLRGPTICEVITKTEAKTVFNRLGPDPLNANPGNREAQRFIARVQASKSPIGLLLMNQDVIAGIGNVYRAELLFRAQITPHRPGNLCTTEELQAIWDDAVKLLRIGVKTGFMITKERLFRKNPTKAERNWVYKREGFPCERCGASVQIELMATRKLYWCPGCQQ
jgi:endonuclease-8